MVDEGASFKILKFILVVLCGMSVSLSTTFSRKQTSTHTLVSSDHRVWWGRGASAWQSIYFQFKWESKNARLSCWITVFFCSSLQLWIENTLALHLRWKKSMLSLKMVFRLAVSQATPREDVWGGGGGRLQLLFFCPSMKKLQLPLTSSHQRSSVVMPKAWEKKGV